MKTNLIKTTLYILIIMSAILIVGYLEHQQMQEDAQAQKDCRLQDEEY